MAAAIVKKIIPARIGTIELTNYDESLNINMDQKKVTVRTINERAQNKLILAIQGELAFEVVEDSASNELPDGDYHLACMNRKKKTQPNTSQTLIRLKKKLHQASYRVGKEIQTIGSQNQK